jgi:hypothetical protein
LFSSSERRAGGGCRVLRVVDRAPCKIRCVLAVPSDVLTNMRSMNREATYLGAETVRVAAPVLELEIPICKEVMFALPDPADPDQAVIVSVPFLVGGLNFGDIVRLGDEDEAGVRPILEVVVASGHAHLLAATEPDEGFELIAELERTFPSHALRIAAANDHLLSISVHPELDHAEVGAVVAAWIGTGAGSDEEPALSEPCETELGPLDWTLVRDG